MDIFLIGIISYLMGSIPFGFILTKIFLKKDIREIGSGNIGATNALRTGNKTIGYSTLILDILKAIASSYLCKNFLPRFFIHCIFVCFFRSCFSNLVKV